MSKMNRTILACLLGGALLVGIGAAVCFIEFNKLEYGGTYELYERQSKTLTQNVALEPDQMIVFDQEGQWGVAYEYAPDPSLPAGTIQIDVDYAPELVTKLEAFALPVEQTRIAQAAAEYMPQVALVVGVDETKASDHHDDLEDLFKAKDVILRDLRNGILHDYDSNWMTYVHVRYSTDLEGRIISDDVFWGEYNVWREETWNDPEYSVVGDEMETDSAQEVAEELDAPGEPSELEPSQLGELKQG